MGFRAALVPFAASLVGRLVYAAEPLILFTVVVRATGSYGVAGGVSAVFGLVCAVTITVRGLLIDRFGPGTVMAGLGVGYLGSIGGLLASVAAGGPQWTFWVLGGAAGLFAPPMGILMRVLCGDLVAPERLPRALGRDAAAEEIIFVAGPLVGGMALAVAPAASALLVTASVMAVSAIMLGRFARRVRMARPGRPASGASAREVFGGLAPVLLGVAGLGASMSMVWLAVVALPDALPGGPGTLLGLLGFGSAVGALVHGRLRRADDPVRRMLLCCAGTLPVLLLLIALPHPGAWAFLLPALGATSSPVVINAYLLASEVPDRLRAQANAWISTSLNAASALGTATAGLLIDASGPAAPLVAGIAFLALLATSAAVLRRVPSPAPVH
ncbi:MFS transporter [Actinocorallia lasiicapitis]